MLSIRKNYKIFIIRCDWQIMTVYTNGSAFRGNRSRLFVPHS
ncbi:Uncharacterized protein dnm_048430 [Desulfonema magnum]|uniref:Uncharacterized protein n=1 Tax=Desulfonema magnum TaxID=45655 RepID=A0A975GPA1_9BACT|nr:Uncharacterized protein dnm_048430 [Desulfonema magnum]